MAGTLVRVFVWVTESRWHNGCLPSRRCDGPALGRCRRERTAPEFTMQYIYTMIGVSKTVPPKRQIIKDISLSFFPGAKIGLLGLNGAGKSTVLRIMAGVDTDFQGEARAQPDQIGRAHV